MNAEEQAQRDELFARVLVTHERELRQIKQQLETDFIVKNEECKLAMSTAMADGEHKGKGVRAFKALIGWLEAQAVRVAGCTRLCEASAETLTESILRFKPQFATPRDGKPWKFTLVLGVAATPLVREAVADISASGGNDQVLVRRPLLDGGALSQQVSDWFIPARDEGKGKDKDKGKGKDQKKGRGRGRGQGQGTDKKAGKGKDKDKGKGKDKAKGPDGKGNKDAWGGWNAGVSGGSAPAGSAVASSTLDSAPPAGAGVPPAVGPAPPAGAPKAAPKAAPRGRATAVAAAVAAIEAVPAGMEGVVEEGEKTEPETDEGGRAGRTYTSETLPPQLKKSRSVSPARTPGLLAGLASEVPGDKGTE